MKEVLTKSFWQGVKSTFYSALEGPAAEDTASHAPADSEPKDSPPSEIPPPSATSEPE